MGTGKFVQDLETVAIVHTLLHPVSSSLTSGLSSRASAAARPQSASPPSASSGYGAGAPQPRGEGRQLLLHVARFIKTGGRKTQTQVPICPRGIQFVLGGPMFSLGFQFVLHLRNIFLGL